MPWIYHELQDAGLCGVHCLNNLLQGPYFGAAELMEIALELDSKEKVLMAELGTDTEDYRKFASEESLNVGMSGDFSANVLQEALDKVWNLKCRDTRAPDLRESVTNPVPEDGFLCHLEDHWIALRKLSDGSWWNLDSLQDAPQYLSEIYLGVFLKQLQLEGWTIYVIRGEYPSPPLNHSAQYWRFMEPGTASDKRAHPKSEQEVFDAELEAAIAASLQDVPTTDSNAPSGPNDSQELPTQLPPNQEQTVDNEEMDEDFKLALQLSMQQDE